MGKQIPIVMSLALLLNVPVAFATTSTASFNAHVKLMAACATSATALDFGTLPGLIQGTETTTSTVTVNCSKGAAYILALLPGSGSMTGQTIPTDKVNYNATLIATSGIGTNCAQLYTIYGSLPTQTTPSAQDYQEIRTVMITY